MAAVVATFRKPEKGMSYLKVPSATLDLRMARVPTESEMVIAAAAVVLTYQVNAGKRFYLQAVLLGCNVSPFVPGDGLFTIDRNSPVGVTDSQFMPEHGLVNVPVQLGRVEPATSSVIAEWPLKRAREFSPLDIIRVKATNVNLAEGAPAFWVCGLFGYEVPSLDVKASR